MDEPSHVKTKTCLVLIQCSALWGMIPVVWAVDLIPVATVLADPSEYHLKAVMLHGIARDVTPLPPYQLKNVLCSQGYTFKLEDKTGSIEVFVRGICGGSLNPQRLPDQILEGDETILEALIIAGSYEEVNVYRANGVVTALSRGFRRCPPC